MNGVSNLCKMPKFGQNFALDLGYNKYNNTNHKPVSTNSDPILQKHPSLSPWFQCEGAYRERRHQSYWGCPRCTCCQIAWNVNGVWREIKTLHNSWIINLSAVRPGKAYNLTGKQHVTVMLQMLASMLYKCSTLTLANLSGLLICTAVPCFKKTPAVHNVINRGMEVIVLLFRMSISI